MSPPLLAGHTCDSASTQQVRSIFMLCGLFTKITSGGGNIIPSWLHACFVWSSLCTRKTNEGSIFGFCDPDMRASSGLSASQSVLHSHHTSGLLKRDNKDARHPHTALIRTKKSVDPLFARRMVGSLRHPIRSPVSLSRRG